MLDAYSSSVITAVTLGVSGHVLVLNSSTKPVASNTAIQSRTDASPREATKDVQSYKLPPEVYQKGVAYSRARYWECFIGSAYFLLIPPVLYALTYNNKIVY